MNSFECFKGRNVLLTGHTGFKGSWMTIWLEMLGAKVTGFSLPQPTQPGNFSSSNVAALLESNIVDDIRNLPALEKAVAQCAPDFIFHMAAQPIVSEGYRDPVANFDVNVMGTVNLLEAVRRYAGKCNVVIVSSDKCYDNREQVWGYRECDPMGGHDPYSASKGCAELVSASYRSSYFSPADIDRHGVKLATARAGNVVGGGDWALDRLVPDIARALAEGRPVELRRPGSVRPWQHVLEPLSGYLMLASRLDQNDGIRFAEGWNFGPLAPSAVTVGEIADLMIEVWGNGSRTATSRNDIPSEAGILRLSIDKAISELGWKPCWDVRETIERTTRWYKEFYSGAKQMLDTSRQEITEYQADMVTGRT